MATGLSVALANSLLNTYCNNTSYVEANVYVKLHIGDPGAAGTSNPAVETDRTEVTFAAAASGAVANDANVVWTNVAASEDYTHFSLWDDPTAGNFLQSGTITAAAVTAGNTFTIPTGDLDLTVTSLAS
jgi:hypothetical protein